VLCTFCDIVAGRSPAHVVHETDHTLAFLDLLPMTPGHTLLVPKRHCVDLLDLPDDDAAHVMQAASRLGGLLASTLGPAGMNLLNNTGAAADQSQFHFHFHLIPRYGGDRLLHPWERRFGNRAELAELAVRIRAGLPDDEAERLAASFLG
jgi:histidine triad (HIT) family protein